MQGELLPAILELEVGERHIADDCVEGSLRQARIAEILDADVLAGMERSSDPPGDGIQFNADEPRPRLSVAHEVAGSASWLQDRGVGGHAEARYGLMDSGDDAGRCVEGVEGGALRAVVFGWCKE